MPTHLPIGMLVLLSRRASVSTEVFSRYWQDVHGPMAARLPGLHHYRQLHLAPAADWWPACAGIDHEPPEQDRVDGIADVGFADAQGQQQYALHAHWTRADECNAFRRSIRYMVAADGQGMQASQEVPSHAPTAESTEPPWSLFALLRRRHGASQSAFESAVRALCSPGASTTASPASARILLLHERDNTQNHLLSADVDHDAPLERQYQAAVEWRFADRFVARRFFLGEAFKAALHAQAATLAAAHLYEVRRTVPMLRAGQITLSGLRGHSTAELIAQVGAANQLHPEIAALFHPGHAGAASP